jgi:hypothetical protein
VLIDPSMCPLAAIGADRGERAALILRLPDGSCIVEMT